MKSLSAIPGVLAIVLGLSIADADIIYVGPGGYPTIQHGLYAASTDDTVLVAPAIYYQNIVWPNTQGIYLLSETGFDSTIINGQSIACVITMNQELDSTTVIDGFTIFNGLGGISCQDGACPTIRNNKIVSNYGSGIYCSSADPIIEENQIIENSAGYGGGIHCAKSWPSTNPKIVGNLISNNTAVLWGGGIFCGEGAIPGIIDNIITNNAAEDGGGIYCWCSDPDPFSGNEITNNSAEIGGGIKLYYCGSTITENTISNNIADQAGGGIHCTFSSPAITWNTITSNTADTGGGIYSWGTNTPSVNYNNIYGNTQYGVYNTTSSVIIDAENNWWGDSTGPGGAGPGTGDEVSEYVDYEPWLFAPVGVEEETRSQKPEARLMIYPNPFSKLIHISFGKGPPDRITHSSYGTGSAECIELKIYDASGRMVRQWDYPTIKLSNQFSWDGTDHANRKLPSGVYFLKLAVSPVGTTGSGGEAGDYTATEKLLLIR